LPSYDYKCKSCQHEFEKIMMMSEMDFPLNEPCPECGNTGDIVKTFKGSPSFQDPASIGIRKPDGEFRNLLSSIKKGNRGGGNIDRYT